MPKYGTLRKRGNIYHYRFMLNGVQKEVSTGETRKREAIHKANEIHDQATAIPATPDNFQLATLVQAYLAREDRKDLSPLTKNEKRYIMQDHIIPHFGPKRDVRDISVFDIEDYVADKTQDLSPNTVVKHFHYLNQMFKYLAKVDIIQKNVVDLADRPGRVKSEASSTFTADQAKRYIEIISDKTASGSLHPAFEIAAHLALLGGCRREECAGVKIEDLRLVEDESPRYAVRIHRGIIIDNRTREVIEKTTKTGEERTIVLPSISTPVIKARILQQKETIMGFRAREREAMGDYLAGDDLFQVINPDWITRTHRRLLKEVGPDTLPYIRFHDLRHTHATLLRDAGVALGDISDKLGHSSITITDAIYIHTDDSRGLISAQAMEKII